MVELCSESKSIAVLASTSASGIAIDNSEISHGNFTYKLLEQLGWNHSKQGNHTFEDNGYCFAVDGDLSEHKEHMTVYEVYDKIMENWDSEYQTPMVNDFAKFLYLV